MEKLINKTKDILVLDDLKRAETFFTRFKGLMGKKINKNEGLLISPCNSIHTFFMKMPIDAIFLNNNNEVLHKISYMQKRKMSPIIKGSKYVIEGFPGIFDCVDIGDNMEMTKSSGRW